MLWVGVPQAVWLQVVCDTERHDTTHTPHLTVRAATGRVSGRQAIGYLAVQSAAARLECGQGHSTHIGSFTLRHHPHPPKEWSGARASTLAQSFSLVETTSPLSHPCLSGPTGLPASLLGWLPPRGGPPLPIHRRNASPSIRSPPSAINNS